MSVGIYRYNVSISNPLAHIIFSESISSEAFYQEFWTKAVNDTNAKLFKDGSSFTSDKIPIVLQELSSLKNWANINISDDTKRLYMIRHIDNIIYKLDNYIKDGYDETFYIF